MRIKDIQKIPPPRTTIPQGVEVTNIFIGDDNKKTILDGFCYKQTITDKDIGLDKFNVGKFVLLTFDGKKNKCAFFFKVFEGAKIIMECVVGPRHVFNGALNAGKCTSFDMFSDILKVFDYKAAQNTYFPNIVMPEVSPVPDDNDTRVVLHNKIENGFAFGRVYRYFSKSDYKTLQNKFVHIEYNNDRIVALIRCINPDSGMISFEVLRYKHLPFEGNESQFGMFEATIVDEYFTAYEYYCDAVGDLHDYKSFKLS